MSHTLSGLIGILVTCSFAGRAYGQACIGLLPADHAPVNTTGNLHMVSQGIGVEGRLGVGSAHAFGGARMGTIGYNHGEKTRSYTAGVDAGYSIALGNGAASVCPIASADYEHGPNNLVQRLSTVSGTAGVSVGGVKLLSKSVALIPFIGAGLQSIRGRYTYPLEHRRLNANGNATVVMTGIGLRVGAEYLVRGSVTVNRGDVEPSASFLIGMTYAWRQ